MPTEILPGAEPFSASGGPVGVVVLHGFTGDLALTARCEIVFAAVLSMGGSLVLWLAERHPEIAGVVVVNPLVDPPAPSFLDMLSGKLEEGAVSVPAIGSDIAMERPRELSYNASPIEPMLSMFEGVDEVARHLSDLHCPVLLFSSRTDHVVPSESGDLLADSAGGPVERIWLERSYHVATLDHDAWEIEERAVAFVKKMAAFQ